MLITILYILCYPFLISGAGVGYFLNPPTSGNSKDFTNNVVWSLGSVQLLQWTTDLDGYNISLWQQNLTGNSAAVANSPIFSHNAGILPTGSISWLVQLPQDFDLETSSVFYLGGGTSVGNAVFTSHYFNITNKAVSVSSSSASTSASSIASSSTSSAASPFQTSSTTAILPTGSAQSSNNGLTGSTKVGLAVGLGVGVPLILLLGIFIGLKFIKRKEPPVRNEPVVEVIADEKPAIRPPTQYWMYEAPGTGHMPGEIHDPYELAAPSPRQLS